MSLTPGPSRLTSSTAPAGSRDEVGTAVPVTRVAAEFSRLFAEHDIAVHPAEVRTLAQRFVTSGRHRIEDIEAVVIAYADPTGEAAARNVDQARSTA